MAGFSSTPSNYPFLKKLRQAKKATLKPCPYLKPTTNLRDYQVIGVLHFLSLARMVLGDGVGLGKCASLDTYIYTSTGMKKLAEFIPENPKEDTLYPYTGTDMLMTMNGPVKPDAVYYCGLTRGLKIKTQDGFELSGLRHHPIFTPLKGSLGYRRLDRLKKDDYICINRKGLFAENYAKIKYTQKSKFKVPKLLKEELAELLGFYISQAQCSEQSPITETVKDRIKDLLKKAFGDGQKDIEVDNPEILDILKHLGVNESGSQGIPKTILCSPESVAVAFMDGYFEGGGAVENASGTINCSSTSGGLINHLQLLLINLGVVSRRKSKEPLHTLSLSKRDFKVIAHGKKRNSGYEYIPIGRELLEQTLDDIFAYIKKISNYSDRGARWRSIIECHFKKLTDGVVYYDKKLTYSLLDSIVEAIDLHNLKDIVSNYSTLKLLQNQNFHFDKIVSVKAVRDTFADFHVPVEHNFMGNGFVNHNTLQMITSFAYRLMSEPNLKMIVVTPKSAMAQWAEEFDKFCSGIKVHILTNEYGEVREKGPDGKMISTGEYGSLEDLKARGVKHRTISGFEARKAQYDTVDAHVLIISYFAVKEDYKFLIENRGPVFQIAFDECFSYHTPITLADGTTELIGKIVTNRMPVEVLSYNFDTGLVEPKKIVNFFRNDSNVWYKVKRKRTSSVICSPNHGFYTPSGKKRADELLSGDIIYGTAKKITDVQRQVILGSLLGDGSIRYSGRVAKGLGCGVVFMQSEKHLPYIKLKEKIMSHHVTSIGIQKTGWNKVPMYRVQTECSPLITKMLKNLNIVNECGKTVMSEEWLRALTPLGLAIWYCDDGSIRKRKGTAVSLSTHSFSKEQNETIIKYFQDVWGIEFIIVPLVRNNHKLYSLRANKDSSEKFLKLISEYIPESMAYKTIYPCGKFWETFKNEDGWDICEDVVEYSTPFKYSNKTFSKYRYNIEVEGNHNYFANNILVSNCQEFKNMKTKTWFGASELSSAAKYCYGMSATIIKNRLEEAYYIYRVVVPGLFPGKIKFFAEYTVRKKMTRWQGPRGKKGNKRYFNKIVGYKNLDQFKNTIDPFFLIRRTRDVADELPRLISRKLLLEMSDAQEQLYRKALSGELYRKLIKEKYFKFEQYASSKEELTEKEEQIYEQLKIKYEESLTKEGLEKNKIAALSYCQLVSNGPGWLGEDGESSKELEFRRLFEQELSDEKVIVFTRFKSGIKRLSAILNDLGLKYVQITGDNSIDERRDARKQFQDMDKDCNVIFITQAGSAAINLQAAGVILYYDTPWSYGDLYQSIGRAQRIGSIREHILLLHMVNVKTIDEHVLGILDSKKDLINQIVGDIAEGALAFKDDEIIFGDEESSVNALFNSVFK